MNAEQLRAVQAPLKQRYRDMPNAALVPARAEATLDPGDVACDVTAWGGAVRAGLHPATGGDGTLGVDSTAPVGLTDITLSFDVNCDADPAKLARMIATTERYCVILQTLRAPPVVRVAARVPH